VERIYRPHNRVSLRPFNAFSCGKTGHYILSILEHIYANKYIVIRTQNYQDDLMKDGDTDGACNRHERGDKCMPNICHKI
jgi:hypothetical protein